MVFLSQYYQRQKNQKRLYSYVKSKQKTSKSINSIRDQAGDVFNTGPEISNILNLYFKSVFVEEDKTAPLPHFESRTNSRLSHVSLDVTDICKRLSELDEYKAPGVDGVHSLILKKCHKEIASPLATVFYRSLNEGCIPDKWRIANITPLHKKGSRLDDWSQLQTSFSDFYPLQSIGTHHPRHSLNSPLLEQSDRERTTRFCKKQSLHHKSTRITRFAHSLTDMQTLDWCDLLGLR